MKKKLFAALALWWAGSSPAWAQFPGCPGGSCPPQRPQASDIRVAAYGAPYQAPGGFPHYQPAPAPWQYPAQAHHGWPASNQGQMGQRFPVQAMPMQAMPMQAMPMQAMPMQPMQAYGGRYPAPQAGPVVPVAFRNPPAPAFVPPPRSGNTPQFLPPSEPYIGTGLPPQKAVPTPQTPEPEVLPPSDPLPMVEEGPITTGDMVLPIAAVVDNPPEPVIRQYVDPLEQPLSRGVLWFGSAEYLRWWLEDQKNVPAQTVITPGGPVTLQADPDNDERTGGRFHLGRWINPLRTIAIEGDYLLLGERRPQSRLSAGPVVASMPPIFDGIDRVDRTIQYHERFWQAELGLRWKAYQKPNWRLDLLGGVRYFELDESATIIGSTVFGQNPVVLSNATVSTVDFFGTDSRFFGGQVGFESEVTCGCFYFQVVGKVAIGNNRQRLTINGLTNVAAPPQPLGNLVFPGGFFAGSTNVGSSSRNRIAFVPELGLWSGVRLNRFAKLSLGYDFLWISDVVRPVDQIDATVAQTLPLSFLGAPFAPTQPRLLFESTSLWAMGLGLRLELQY